MICTIRPGLAEAGVTLWGRFDVGTEAFDYIVVGAGSAGCVLANRLSADPANRVLLLEAGGKDNNLMVRIPRGFGKLLGNPRFAWFFMTRPFGKGERVEAWVRGKTLGGSSAVNGMVYNRGAAADWDGLAALTGNDAWGWESIVAKYREIEDNQLGASPTRGVGGPLGISTGVIRSAICDEMIEATTAIGLRRVDDLNESDDERVGYAMANIKKGQRVSAAAAFLHPVSSRPNLSVAIDSPATSLVFEGDKVVGVRTGSGGTAAEHRANREVILALGSIQTPRLLQLSGIGPPEVLRAAGIDVRIDQPNVGARMREHHCFLLQMRLRENIGYNRKLSSPVAQLTSGIQYLTTRGGALAAPSYDVVGFMKTRPDLDRVDAQILMAPWTTEPQVPGKEVGLEREPGLQCIGYVLRPDSEGTVQITGADPDAPLDIDPNFYATEHDREIGVRIFERMRSIFRSSPIAERIASETVPGPGVQDDEDVIQENLERGYCGYHAIGTCAMGTNDDAVVDPQLRVRGVDNLRIMDCSVLPVMVAGNLNGPMMAMAARAAEVILADR
jgi:choline dehydrogenase-like flavoprotein